jgi:hypothetical protein
MLFFAETFALKLVKFSLEDKMLTTVVSEELTGYPDGVDCSESLCYAVMPSAIPPLVKWLLIIPYPLDVVVRSLLMALPKKMAPPVEKYGGIVEVDVFGTMGGGSVRLIQDPLAADVGMINGVTVHNNKLYLGSLQNNYIAVYDLS